MLIHQTIHTSLEQLFCKRHPKHRSETANRSAPPKSSCWSITQASLSHWCQWYWTIPPPRHVSIYKNVRKKINAMKQKCQKWLFITLVMLSWSKTHSVIDSSSKPSILSEQSGANSIASLVAKAVSFTFSLSQISPLKRLQETSTSSFNNCTYSLIRSTKWLGSLSQNKFNILTWSSMNELKALFNVLRVKITENLPRNHLVKAVKICYESYNSDEY